MSFFLRGLLRGVREDAKGEAAIVGDMGEEREGRRNCTRTETPCVKEGGGEETPARDAQGKTHGRVGCARPLRCPEWHRFLSAAEDAKKENDFRARSKKLKYC